MEGVESLDQLWSFFGRQTTFHGVKNIESHERRQSARLASCDNDLNNNDIDVC